MRRIAICNTSFERGDAVSNDMLGMYRVLQELGHEVRLFTAGDSDSEPRTFPFKEAKGFLRSKEDIIIYHYATGWTEGVSTLEELKCKKAIKYHNVTPAEFFGGVSEGYVNMCRAGREQLKRMCEMGCELYMACSSYSLDELLEQGAQKSRCRVVPPFHQINSLRKTEADLNLLGRYLDGKVNLLMVGRIVPNKNYEFLIDVFSVYHRFYNSDSRLFLIGSHDENMNSYINKIKDKIANYNIAKDVIFTGKINTESLKSYYLLADIFICTSNHEGFCVPIVEAMSMKIPVVAYASSAIPETVGEAGIVWDLSDPDLFAATIDRIAREGGLKVGIGERGWRRFNESFSTERIRDAFLEGIGPLL